MKRNRILGTMITAPFVGFVVVNAPLIIAPLVARAAEYGSMLGSVSTAKKLMVLVVVVTVRGQLIATLRRRWTRT